MTLAEAIRAVSRTGINLIGQKLGVSTTGAPFYDKLARETEIETFPVGEQISHIKRWGRLSAYADRRTFLVVQCNDGNQYVINVSKQDSSNRAMAAKILSLLKRDGSFRLMKTSGISWTEVSEIGANQQ